MHLSDVLCKTQNLQTSIPETSAVSAVQCKHKLLLPVKLLSDFHKHYTGKLATKMWTIKHLYVSLTTPFRSISERGKVSLNKTLA